MLSATEPVVAGSTARPATAAPAAAIELVGIEKTYAGAQEHTAVRDLDLRVEDGEFFSLLGPSGCGKSTTLRMVAGFEDPTAGSVLLHGQDVTRLGPHRRDVNMVFQNYALFPHLDVRDNIAFGLRRRKIAKAEIARRVDEVVALVELGGREGRMPRELSGGQQQRVALARALVNRPRALLLDEPLGALDLQLRQSMQLELKRIQREVGITFIYVTHDQSEALTMSDRLAVMNDGRIEQLGAPRDVYERPATVFVAGFIGTSNVLRGTTSRLVGDTLVIEVGPDEQVAVPAGEGHRIGDEVAFTVRPEKVTILTEAPATGPRLRATVDEVVYLGTSTSYVLRTTLADGVTAFQQNSASVVQHDRGDEVWISWLPEHVRTYPS